jgi:hypothetical protein
MVRRELARLVVCKASHNCLDIIVLDGTWWRGGGGDI